MDDNALEIIKSNIVAAVDILTAEHATPYSRHLANAYLYKMWNLNGDDLFLPMLPTPTQKKTDE